MRIKSGNVITNDVQVMEITGADLSETAKGEAVVDISAIAGTGNTVAGVRGYGDSRIVQATHTYVPSDRYLTKVKQALGAKIEKNYGIGGSRMMQQTSDRGWAEVWTHAINELPQPAPSLLGYERPPREGLMVLHWLINDVGQYGAQTGWDTAFYHTGRAVTSMCEAGYAWQPNGGPGSGRFSTVGWTNATNADFGGPYVKHGAGSNITLTYTTESGHQGGTMVFYIAQSKGLGESCVVTAKIDGGPTVFSLDTTGIGITDGGNPAIPIAIYVPNVPAGSGHVVTLTFSTITTNINFLGATLNARWPPIVLWVNTPEIMGSQSLTPPPTWPNATVANVRLGNTAIDNIVSYLDSDSVAVVDTSDMSGVAEFFVDDLHFDPNGNGHLADLMLDEIHDIGGIPVGYSAGPDLTTNGPPTFSGAPADSFMIDPATGILYTPSDIDTIVGLQPVNDLLLDISGTSPADLDMFQYRAGHVTNRTPNQIAADLIAAGLYTLVPAGGVVFSALGTTLVAEPTEVAMVALINAMGEPIYDTHANRIAAAHQKGVHWIETDTGLEYYDDGVDWKIVSPLGQVLKLGVSQTIDGNPAAAPSATTLRDITELSFPVEAGERWEVITHLWVTADSNTPKLKLFWTLPGGAGDTFTIIKTGDLTSPSTGTNAVAANVDAVSNLGGVGGISEAITTTEITVGANAGTVQLRAAQFAAGGIGHDTIIGGQTDGLTSSLRLRKLSAL